MTVDTETLANAVREELHTATELWNPQYLSVDDWEIEIPIQKGVSIRVYAVDSKEHYELQTLTATVGDIGVTEEEILETIADVLAAEFSFANRIDMENFSHGSICLVIPYESVEENTDTVSVQTDWGESPLQVNVPTELESQESYAIEVAEQMAYQRLNRLLDEVSESHPRSPSFTVES